MNPQTQSAFFTILNKDIRNHICMYLFGCVTVNMDHVSSGFCDYRFCPNQGHHYHTALLYTCQRAYMEGIRVLYSTNVFKFSEGGSLSHWRASLQAPRWGLVRKVDLRIRLAADLYHWAEAWDILCSMPDLRSAKLRCETEIRLACRLSKGIVREIKDPFKDGTFFLPLALRPMLRPRMSAETNFGILFNVERRETLGILIKELRACGMRGVRIGWVTLTERVGIGPLGVYRVTNSCIEWEEI